MPSRAYVIAVLTGLFRWYPRERDADPQVVDSGIPTILASELFNGSNLLAPGRGKGIARKAFLQAILIDPTVLTRAVNPSANVRRQCPSVAFHAPENEVGKHRWRANSR